MSRSAPRLLVLLVCGLFLAACDTVSGTARAADSDQAQKNQAMGKPDDLDSSVRQAQSLRQAGQYDGALKILSQLMLVASDDSRVVGEYGKTLVEQGRASEAAQFLSRAAELSPGDWTVYSAMGVADDQLGDQAGARMAYEHALALKPAEPSVLNNYALSRMQANDPVLARQLIDRAQIAGGASDPKIARNIALLNQLAPAPQPTPLAYAVPKPAPTVMAVSAPGQPATPTGMPRPLVQQQNLAAPPANTVVMQRVPVDPLAGPVKPRPARALAATPHASVKAAKLDAPDTKAASVKPVPAADAKAAAIVKPGKPAKDAVPALRMTADATP
jgi:Flp pilus assembly protein TadD